MDYYKILGVEKDATQNEIQQAYRKLAIQYHPDKNPGDEEAVKKFKEVAEAFEVLNDGDKRRNYDLRGTRNFHNFGGFDPFSIFGDFFNEQRTSRTEHIFKECQITLRDVKNGCLKTVEVEKITSCKHCETTGYTSWKQCSACNGHGSHQQISGVFSFITNCTRCSGRGKLPDSQCKECNGFGSIKEGLESVEIKLPSGVVNNTNFILRNRAFSVNGPCDLIVNVKVIEHNFFKRNDNNLHCCIDLTYAQCVLGYEYEIKDLDEKTVTIKVPPLTKPNTPIRLNGLGINNGDIVATVRLKFPEKPSDKYLELVQQLDNV
jgi:molecular chaperone DnaJ